jgi:hypothetical protein
VGQPTVGSNPTPSAVFVELNFSSGDAEVIGCQLSFGAVSAVIRVYDAAGKAIETHEHVGDFKEW